ncbi:MAG TPA: RNA methyltransferase [Lachnospiraceae bacterium]|nr:RNA methyltransferase [Lachnospiraceae bacterium]
MGLKALGTALPPAFKDRMREQLGDEYGAFIESYGQSSLRALRLNPLKMEKKELIDLFSQNKGLAPFFHLENIPWEETGFYYGSEDEPGRSPYHDAGVYYIQEPSAMLPVNLLMSGSSQGEEGLRILDLCAAPGGKSTQIAARMNGKGLLICNEVIPARCRILSENIERMAVRNAIVLNEEPDRLSERFEEYFDRILVDAPCSGEGMFRKNEAAVSEWSEEIVKLCAERQQEILKAADRMLKYGGTLVYSTCTFSKAENEETTEIFLKEHPEYRLKEQIRLMPHRIKGEGHFAAKLIKGEGDPSELSLRGKKGRASLSPEDVRDFFQFADENLVSVEDSVGITKKDPMGKALIRFGDNLYLAPGECPELTGLKVLRPGLQLGTSRKGHFIPSHALALSLKPGDFRRSVMLPVYTEGSGEGDLRIKEYLKGMTFPFEGENGWYLICADGFSAGFGKLSGNVMKNHYPKGLRRQ